MVYSLIRGIALKRFGFGERCHVLPTLGLVMCGVD